MMGRLADEANQLQAIDVGHVDVGNDQVEGAPRQKPHGVKPAARLKDFAATTSRGELGPLEDGANKRSSGDRVFGNEHPTHVPSTLGYTERTLFAQFDIGANLTTWIAPPLVCLAGPGPPLVCLAGPVPPLVLLAGPRPPLPCPAGPR